MVMTMPNQYEKLVEQQARLKQKIEREDPGIFLILNSAT
ncbi:hypothetical protein LCAUW4_0059 [Lacticaseibacillus casei UW4]|nr:hypothetical protein LCAUW4_0059 [Lacticaseibacillus casei UW4]